MMYVKSTGNLGTRILGGLMATKKHFFPLRSFIIKDGLGIVLRRINGWVMLLFRNNIHYVMHGRA
jgi:hypothetical protein